MLVLKTYTCADPEFFARGGPTLVLDDEGERIQMPLKMGHHRPASETHLMAFRWRADNGPKLNDGLVAL